MTEDLIAMAHEAGFLYFNSGKFSEHGAIRRFAALVEARAVARTREECAKVCDGVSRAAAKDWKARYDPHDQGREFGADECESAIRALGERT